MKVFKKIIQLGRNFVFELRARMAEVVDEVKNEVSFVCQFSTAAAAEPSLTGKLKPQEDPNWAESGALSQARYADWAYTMCGMASAAMVIEYFTGKQYKPAVLAEDALQHGVYTETAGEDISSMKYAEFAAWVTRHGIRAQVYSKLSMKGIVYALSSGGLVIASVNPNIRGFSTAPEGQCGGHLVVVSGYNKHEGTVSINNPSGFESLASQKDHSLLIADFVKHFAGRGIVLSNT